jgi:hypothetical protein
MSRNRNYVPPYDNQEKHMPGMNYCGPGTNVWRRLREKVKPIDALDSACKSHDLVTEPRGPYTSKGNARKLRAADQKLRDKALKLSMPWSSYPNKELAALVVVAMEYVLRTGTRGRRIK